MKTYMMTTDLNTACYHAHNIAANYEKALLHPVFSQQLAAEQPICGVDLRQVIITPDTYNGVTNIIVEALASGADNHHVVLSFDTAPETPYKICYVNLQEDTVPWFELIKIWSEMINNCIREKADDEVTEMLAQIARVHEACPNINYTLDWEQGYHFVTYKGIAMVRYREGESYSDLRTEHPLWIPFLDELEEHTCKTS